MEVIGDFFLRWGLETIGVLILTGFGIIWKKIKKEVKEQAAIEEGVRVLLHDRLYNVHQYYLEQGYIYPADLKNVEHIYNAYHLLGGNGTGTSLYTEMTNLPKKRKKETI